MFVQARRSSIAEGYRLSSSALKNRNFLIYLTGSVISLHGLWVYRVALAWFAWQLTQSEFWVGIIAFTQFAPAIVFGPLFGVIADRHERRKISMLVNTASALNMTVLATLAFNDQVGIVVLTITSLIQGALDGAHTPVRMSLVPGIVEREQLSSAIATNSITFNLSRVIGPAISGVIIATLGVAWAFAINAVTYLAIVLAVGVISIQRRESRKSGPSNIWSEIMEGVHYVRGHVGLQILLLAISINTVFGRGALEMMPAVADVVLQRGSAGLAVLTSSVGAGAVMIGIILSWGTRWLNLSTLKYSLLITSGLIIVFGLTSSFAVSAISVCLLGVMLSLCGVGSQILIQTWVDDDVRGRVSSLWGMIAFGGTSFGGLAIGYAASVFGLQITIGVAGLLCLFFAATLKTKALGPAS